MDQDSSSKYGGALRLRGSDGRTVCYGICAAQCNSSHNQGAVKRKAIAPSQDPDFCGGETSEYADLPPSGTRQVHLGQLGHSFPPSAIVLGCAQQQQQQYLPSAREGDIYASECWLSMAAMTGANTGGCAGCLHPEPSRSSHD